MSIKGGPDKKTMRDLRKKNKLKKSAYVRKKRAGVVVRYTDEPMVTTIISPQKSPFSVTKENLLAFLGRDLGFRLLRTEGKYVLVDGQFVIKNIGNYLLKTGMPITTFVKKYGKQLGISSLYDITLHFERQVAVGVRGGNNVKVICGEVRPRSYRGLKLVNATKLHRFDSISQKEFMQMLGFGGNGNDIGGNGGGGDEPPSEFKRLLDGHLKRKKVTIENLAELTGISDRTLRRMRNEPDYPNNIGFVVAICIALHLLPDESTELVKAAGLSFRTTLEGRAYLMLVCYAFEMTVGECNIFLLRMNLSPLTNLR